MSWDIYFTAHAEQWILELNDTDYEAIMAAVELLEERGPSLGRPAVDRIAGSRHHHMKELRSFGGHLRALFCFNPEATRSCSSAATSATTGRAGRSATSRSPMTSMTSTSDCRDWADGTTPRRDP